MTLDHDTIAAIATPVGQGGIGIVRISGPCALDIAGNVFRPRRPNAAFESHRLYLGDLIDPHTGNPIDEVLLSCMRAPHSYTCEDIVEINSHSGYRLLSKILEILLDQGARPARPGEFTLRAFLNNRIDLTQAEAVVDLINARSEKGLVVASRQISGTFKRQIEGLRQKAIEILAHAEVAIDFPEEESDRFSRQTGAEAIAHDLIDPIEELIAAHAGRIWVEGISTVIVGRVNAGKSSLLNCLLNEDRAIVTPVPGTTRDIIESAINVGGIPLKLMDTAGFRAVFDEVEKVGIQLTRQKMSEADLVLIVIDRSRPLDHEDLEIIRQAQGMLALVVVNKIDLPSRLSPKDTSRIFAAFPHVVEISALTGQGIEALKKAVAQLITGEAAGPPSSEAVPNLRHRRALADASLAFQAAKENTAQDAPVEIVALELKTGLDALGEITGETSPDQVLDAVFSQFCLGK
ncbi:MAG: tRNA uridine-5-carboxymethylaminomethyl(34) synthesis GTPase MnmE [Desulfatiglandaceae bacterium]